MNLSIVQFVFIIFEAILILTFTLTINRYNIGKHYKRVLAAGALLGLVFFGNLQLPLTATGRFLLNGLISYGLILGFFGFSKIRSLLVALTLLSTGLLHDSSLTVILVYSMHMPVERLSTGTGPYLMYFWVGLVPLILITYLAWQKKWRLPPGISEIGKPGFPQQSKNTLLLLVFAQFLLLFAAFIEYLVNIPAHNGSMTVTKHIIIFGSFIVSILLNFFIARNIIVVREKEALLAAQEAMADSYQSLTGAMQAQNNDFAGHIHNISDFIQKGRLKELSNYLENVSGKITVLNDALKIDNPIIGALLKSKITEADVHGIRMEIDISVSLANLGTRSLDLARIIGNLVDNAFDAVLFSEKAEKYVLLKIGVVGPLLQLQVSNRGPTIPLEVQQHIFEPGYSGKGEGHSGLGLHIVKTLTDKLLGTVRVSSDEQCTRFIVMLPKI